MFRFASCVDGLVNYFTDRPSFFIMSFSVKRFQIVRTCILSMSATLSKRDPDLVIISCTCDYSALGDFAFVYNYEEIHKFVGFFVL